jgi:LuxR family maltose regulon positive regulatory protein
VPPFAIRRMRLEERLDEHPDRHVVLVRGPAGAGKTVLVAQWAGAQSQPCAWLSIDATHNNETVLLRQLVEAVEQLSADLSVGRSAVAGGIDHGALWDVLCSVTQHLGSGITLVLDDVHRLHDRQARHVLELLVEHPPDDVRVVLVSRSKPRLLIERARLRGDLVEITPPELRFERAEINLLTSTWTDWQTDAAELEQATLGWAAGLRLEHLQHSTGDTPFPGRPDSNGIASKYIRELIDECSAGTRSFLEVSCWLPVLTEPLCAAVAGDKSGRPSLIRPDIEALEALPVLPIASRPGTFRHPPILTRVIQQQLRRGDARAALTARRRAAEACRDTGDLVTAIELFLQAAGPDEAAEACAQLAATDESSLRRVDELLRRLHETPPESTEWLAWRIRAAVAAGRIDEARRLLDQADAAPASTDGAGQADSQDLVIARAVMAEHLGDVVGLLASANRLLTPVEQTGTSPCAIARAHGWRMRALVWAGDAEGARVALRKLDEAAVGTAPEAAVDIALARAWVAWLDGDISGVAETVAAAEREISDSGSGSAELALLAGSAHRERNQLAKAVSLLDEAHTVAATFSHHVVAALAASELARCHRVTGADMEALELVVSTRAVHLDLPPAIDVHLRSTEVKVRLDQGDVVGAQATLREAPSEADTQLLAARVALQHAPAQARELLEAVDARVPRQAAEQLLLRAQLPDADPDEESAAIIEAVAVGGPLGLVRTFLDERATLSRLSQLALDHPDRTLGRLAALACHELAKTPTRQHTGPTEQLTARELAVLRMLPLRMSNREMAAQLYISVNTLKTHVRAIYRKLDVPHRSAAVHRATALQLV